MENYSLCSDQTVETLMDPWPCSWKKCLCVRKLKICGLLYIFALERSSLSKYNQAAIWLHHILFQISCHGCGTFLDRIRSTAMHILQFEFFMCCCITLSSCIGCTIAFNFASSALLQKRSHKRAQFVSKLIENALFNTNSIKAFI